MIKRQGSLGQGIFAALLLAGPLFVAAAVSAHSYMQIPHAIAVAPELPIYALSALAPVVIGGFLISLPANLIGGLVMGALADHFAPFRPHIVWTAAGLLLGTAIAISLSWDYEPVSFSLIFTSTACARLCRQWVDWADDGASEEWISPWARATWSR